MQVLRVRLNKEHIAEAQQSGTENPLLAAIVKATGCDWLMSECGAGIETEPPHRQFLLEGDILNLWRLFRATGEIAPCIFYLGLHDTPEAGGLEAGRAGYGNKENVSETSAPAAKRPFDEGQ